MTSFKSLCAPSVAFNSTSGRIEVSNDGRKVGRSIYKNWDKWNAEHRGEQHPSNGAYEATAHANVATSQASRSDASSDHLAAHEAHRAALMKHKDARAATGDKVHDDQITHHRERSNHHLVKYIELSKSEDEK